MRPRRGAGVLLLLLLLPPLLLVLGGACRVCEAAFLWIFEAGNAELVSKFFAGRTARVEFPETAVFWTDHTKHALLLQRDLRYPIMSHAHYAHT